MLVKFEQNRIVQTTQNFELLDKNKTKQNKTKQNKTKQNKNKKTKKKQKTVFFITTFDKELMPFWKTFSVAEIIV